MTKREFTDEMYTFIHFNATMTSAACIKDVDYKRNAKKWLNLWYKTGVTMWKEIKRETKNEPEAIDTYEELALYVNEVVKIALQQPNYDKFLERISKYKTQ